jgi:trigger factor
LNSNEVKPNCTREIQVEIPVEVVAGETETLVSKYQRTARIPGFRKGKVPATIIRQRFAEDLKSEVVETLVPKYFHQETEKQGLNPVSQPKVSDLHVHDGEPLRFKATFEVLPEIELAGYRDLAPEKPEITVTDEEVQESLNRLTEQQATYAAVEDRPLQDGDYAQVSFTGTPQAAPAPEGEAASADKAAPAAQPINVEEVMVEIGGSNTVKEFTENLRGAAPGEERTFSVVYPEDFADQRLAGKTFGYTVRIKAVKQKTLPEQNDEFAKQVGDFENLEVLRTRIREGLTAEKEHEADRAAKEKIIAELEKRHDFPVPDALVEQQIDVQLERGLRALAAQGMRTEDLKKLDWTRLRDGQRESARKEVKISLLLDRIASAEKIDATDEEVDHEVEALAQQARQPVEQVRERFAKEGALDQIRSRVRNDKTLDFLCTKPA